MKQKDAASSYGLTSVNLVSGTVEWSAALSGLDPFVGLAIDASGHAYVLQLSDGLEHKSITLVRYLSNGVRSAVRRMAGSPSALHMIPGHGLRVVGTVGTREKGVGPFIARYD